MHLMIYLNNVIRLFSRIDKPLHEVLMTFVHMVPEGWQYPEVTRVRLTLDIGVYQTANFEAGPWTLSHPIYVADEEVGKIEVSYIEERPEADHGPFLHGEVILIKTLATELGHFLERWELLSQREQHRRDLELYTSILRHDLANDLSVLMTNTELIGMLVPEEFTDVHERVRSTLAVCERVADLLNLLSTAPAEPETLLMGVIERAVERARAAWPELNIHVKVTPGAKSARVLPSRLLGTVIDNLLRNVTQHVGESAEVTISVDVEDGKIVALVSDNGPGIDPAVKPHLFERGTSTQGGGLGLYLCRQIVRAVGGEIVLVESGGHSGATFRIELPITT